MKKIILLFILSSNLGIVNAQITIDGTGLMTIGDVLIQAEDTLITGIAIGAGGVNQSWDLSWLGDDNVDTISFQDPSTFPGSVNFPSSNIGMVSSEDYNVYLFATKNTSELTLDGAYLDLPPYFAIPIDDAFLSFPSSMGTTYNNNLNFILYSYVVGVDPDGPAGPSPFIQEVKVEATVALSSEIDGWGDVTTPYGTSSSLRQNVVKEQVDSTFMKVAGMWFPMDPVVANALGLGGSISHDTTRRVRWWNNDFNLVDMEYDVNGNALNAIWHKSTLSAGISEFEAAEFQLFPNPTSTTISIDINDQIELIEIYDITGNLVQEETSKIFSVEDLPQGIYMVKLKTNNHVLNSRFVKE